MMESAGILAYKKDAGRLLFFLVHPGGPFFAKRDSGIWTIPKGLIERGEDPLETAMREFFEETGVELKGDFINLGHIVQKGGKKVHGFAVAFDVDASAIKSNLFEMIWPPKSGRMQSFPEIDRAAWFEFDEAREKINGRQVAFLVKLNDQLV